MIVIYWYIGKIDKLKVSQKNIGNCLFSVILSILAPNFAVSTVFYLFPPPKTLLSSYYYQIFCINIVAIHVLSICHQDMWKNLLEISCLLDFCYFSTTFQHFSVYSSHFYRDVHAKPMAFSEVDDKDIN